MRSVTTLLAAFSQLVAPPCRRGVRQPFAGMVALMLLGMLARIRGLDLAIRDQLGYAVQARIQTAIVEKHHGELPVGCAEIVETNHDWWKYMVSAATMRIPEPVAHTVNAYTTFRTILLAVAKFNQAAGTRAIVSLVCCGLGTGVGGMPAARCAGQMHAAYKSMLMPALIGRFESIHGFHDMLRKL